MWDRNRIVCLPARDRRLGIFAGTGRWYSNMVEGEESNIEKDGWMVSGWRKSDDYRKE